MANFDDLQGAVAQFGANNKVIFDDTVIALYCWKAKAENIIKIKKGYPEETKDISVDLNNINI